MASHCRKRKPKDQEGSHLPEGIWCLTPAMVASLEKGGLQGSQAAGF